MFQDFFCLNLKIHQNFSLKESYNPNGNLEQNIDLCACTEQSVCVSKPFITELVSAAKDLPKMRHRLIPLAANHF